MLPAKCHRESSVARGSLWGFFLRCHCLHVAFCPVSTWPSTLSPPCPSLMGALIIGVEAPRVILGDAISKFLIASAKTLFSKSHSDSVEYTFRGATALLTTCRFHCGGTSQGVCICPKDRLGSPVTESTLVFGFWFLVFLFS